MLEKRIWKELLSALSVSPARRVPLSFHNLVNSGESFFKSRNPVDSCDNLMTTSSVDDSRYLMTGSECDERAHIG